jgi:hypothetical protein
MAVPAPISLDAVGQAATLQVPMQATTVSVLATWLLFAAFLSLTAFIAARNLLGDVSLRRHALVGPPIAAIAFLAATFEFSPALALGAALVVDAAAFRYLHDLDRRLLAGVVVIHFVVSVILGAILFSLIALIGSAPI